ncbi:hypothetical protein K1719_017024 [Acacia pycnantha]|nr:hypothetical protein K1719_017024 [Acacia pycnantha]
MDPNQQRAAPRTQTSSCFMLTVFLPFSAIMSATVLILSSTSSSFKNSISTLHQVPEGHVGVYRKGGFQVKMPFITQYDPIQVTLHTELVPDISCVTKGGIKISFKNIQVVHQLQKEYVYETLLNYGVQYKKTWIHDKIHHHIIQFCTSHSFQEIGEEMKEALQVDCTRYAPGIEIIGVHVTKLDIPDSISRNFEQLEDERIKVLIAVKKLRIKCTYNVKGAGQTLISTRLQKRQRQTG